MFQWWWWWWWGLSLCFLLLGLWQQGTNTTTLSLIVVSDGHQLRRTPHYILTTTQPLQMSTQDEDLSQHLQISPGEEYQPREQELGDYQD